jgi:hypothetical protein
MQLSWQAVELTAVVLPQYWLVRSGAAVPWTLQPAMVFVGIADEVVVVVAVALVVV